MFEKLTEREQEIYELLLKGYSRPEISKILCIERSTVQTHISSIFQKKDFDGHNALQKMICDYYKNILNTLQTNNQERF